MTVLFLGELKSLCYRGKSQCLKLVANEKVIFHVGLCHGFVLEHPDAVTLISKRSMERVHHPSSDAPPSGCRRNSSWRRKNSEWTEYTKPQASINPVWTLQEHLKTPGCGEKIEVWVRGLPWGILLMLSVHEDIRIKRPLPVPFSLRELIKPVSQQCSLICNLDNSVTQGNASHQNRCSTITKLGYWRWSLGGLLAEALNQ